MNLITVGLEARSFETKKQEQTGLDSILLLTGPDFAVISAGMLIYRHKITTSKHFGTIFAQKEI